MNISDIDYVAIYGNSKFHNITSSAKVIFTCLVLTSIIISQSLIVQIALLGLLLSLYKVANLSLRIARLAIYPAIFAIIFAVLVSRQGLDYSLYIMLKAVNAALTMILLITTTPYVEVFAVMSKVLPDLLVDVFFMTYRSFFILLDRINSLLKAVKVKGGYHPLRVFLNIRTIAAVLGTLILHALDMSERMYKILELRGYSGKIPIEANMKIHKKDDYFLLSLGLIVLVGVVLQWNIL